MRRSIEPTRSLHIEEAKSTAADQIQAHYELLLENNESKIACFEEARSRRQQAVADAREHASSDQEFAVVRPTGIFLRPVRRQLP